MAQSNKLYQALATYKISPASPFIMFCDVFILKEGIQLLFKPVFNLLVLYL